MIHVTFFVIWLLGFLVCLGWWHMRGESCIWCGEDLHPGYCKHVRNQPPPPPRDEDDE